MFDSCPFCGNDALTVTSEETFNELQGENNTASIRVICWKCSTDMGEHSFGEHDYAERLRLLALKWNRRVSGERI